MPDGEDVLVLSDETGEFEFVALPADGVGNEQVLTDDGTILRYQGYPSPDGTWVAYDDKNNDVWLLNVESGDQKIISTNREGIGEIAWSPDSRWIAFVQGATNTFTQIYVFDVESGILTPLTSDRFNNRYPVWSPDGEWIYFLSDRNLRSVVGSPWGPRQPEPYFDKPMKLYQVALTADGRPPFRPDDELHPDGKGEEEKKDENGDDNAVTPVEIELAGIQQRVWEVPIEPGNYRGIGVNKKALFWITRDPGLDGNSHLMAAKISSNKVEPKKIVEGVRSFEMSADGKKILVRKGDDLYVIDAVAKEPTKLAEHKVDLDGWTFAINVREDWLTPACTGSTGTAFVTSTCRSSTG
jgi:tricorn protease